MIPPSHDSTVIRASILDVCLQLGALDSNNPVAEWMFSDLATPSQQSQSKELRVVERPWKPERHGSRFHERISPTLQLEETAVLDVEVRRTPWFRRSRKSKPNGELHNGYADDTIRRETGILSLRSLFRRRRSGDRHDDGNMDANDIGVRPSTNSELALHPGHYYPGAESSDAPSIHRSLPPIPASSSQATSFYAVATPAAQTLHEDSDRDGDSHNDDDWEEVEIRPQSLVHAMMLNNCLPPPKRLKKRRPKVVEDIVEEDEQAQSISCSLVLPRSMTPKSRKSTPRPRPLSVYSPSGSQSHRVYAHARSLSTPTPPSPSILATPSATPQSMPSMDTYFGESPRKPLLAHRPSMGYHNQFFVRRPSQPATPAPSLPPSSPSSHRGRLVSFSKQRIPSAV